MLLAVDIGNTNIVLAVFDGEKIVTQWRIATDARRTGDEYTSIILTLARDAEIDVSCIKKSIISSVVPALIGPFVIVCQHITKAQPYVISSSLAVSGKLPVHQGPNSTRELGTDLLCNALASWKLFGGKPNIVVDFGTALTLTFTDADGVIQGGTICPGLGTAVKALATNAAQLPYVALEAPQSVIGSTTKEAIQSGIVLGYRGLVESLVKEIKKEYQAKSGMKAEDVQVVATGGLNSVLKPITDCFTIVDKDLTVKGLRLISEIVQ